MSPARATGIVILALASLLGGACGARSQLPLPVPCGEPGRTRACQDICGDGEQVCENGYWQPCVVPVATRPCTNTCGPGTQQCIDGAWLTCSVPVAERPCSSICGPGKETCADDAWGPCDAPQPGPPTLSATVRDFHVGQPDFVPMCCMGRVDLGIAAATLGADGTPVYTGNPTTPTTHGAKDFYAWYHDVPGVNVSTTVSLPFSPEQDYPGTNAFDDERFYPIDGQLFGNQGEPHNEFFTLQAHATILYNGGESYGFAGDDDLWVFLNGHLVLDLGGIHSRETNGVQLDEVAASLGLQVGQKYPLDLFYANRQPPEAVLAITIPQADLWGCP
jgi:fibro-slime domain-containing protein